MTNNNYIQRLESTCYLSCKYCLNKNSCYPTSEPLFLASCDELHPDFLLIRSIIIKGYQGSNSPIDINFTNWLIQCYEDNK